MNAHYHFNVDTGKQNSLSNRTIAYAKQGNANNYLAKNDSSTRF